MWCARSVTQAVGLGCHRDARLWRKRPIARIAKPIICWEDSPRLGYEILPNKYFYRCQPPTPAKELLAEFGKLEKEKMLEGLANA